MDIIWDFLSVLFYLSLVMLAASAFTPRTALFFKEKSRLRGAIIWMSGVLVCGFLVHECAPRVEVPELEQARANATRPAPAARPVTPRPPAPSLPQGVTLPPHEVEIVSALPGQRLSLEGQLNAATDEQTLRYLSIKAYADKKGRNFDTLFITWYLAGQDRAAGPFAETSYRDGVWQVRFDGAGKAGAESPAQVPEDSPQEREAAGREKEQ